ncbi:MAG: acetyltransferase [Gammaproteobacteria bacterium]|nr:acetyltransferase [Gammaproteobacteria bacterium]
MPDNKIILIGGGGHCRSCIDVIESYGTFKIAGIVEQPGKDNLKSVLGYPIIGNDYELADLRKQYEFALITMGQIGSSNTRHKIFNHLKKLGFTLPVIISSLAHVSKHAAIDEGTIVMHQVIVNANANIGKNCILNTRCLIEHDAKIGGHSHISTAAVVNGDVRVGSGSFVGSNATIAHGVRLPENYFFKAGSLIVSEKNGKLIGDNHL